MESNRELKIESMPDIDSEEDDVLMEMEMEMEMDMSHSDDWHDFAHEDGTKKKRYKSTYHEIISSLINNNNNIHPNAKAMEEKFIILKGMDIENVVKENVLPLLPAKILTRFRMVSKQWDSWIKGHILSHRQSYSHLRTSGFFCQPLDSNPTFLSLNPSAYGVPTPPLDFLPGKFNVVASSHGLVVCRSQDVNNTYYVCNPANHTWRKLPNPEYYHGLNSAHVLMLDPRMQNIEGHYHLVCVCSMVGQQVVCFEIYSSETNSWRCSGAMCLEFEDINFFAGPGFHMKGVAYWVTSMMQVLAFDLKNDMYEIMPLPGQCSSLGTLACINGELCYASISPTLNKYVMRMCYGVGLSRSREIDLELEPDPIGAEGLCRVLACFEEDRLIILFGGVLYSYSVVDESIEVVRRGVWNAATMEANTKFLPYVNSLVRVV